MSRRSGSTAVELLPVHFKFGWASLKDLLSPSHSVNVGQIAAAAARAQRPVFSARVVTVVI
jgi:hypothetical protein